MTPQQQNIRAPRSEEMQKFDPQTCFQTQARSEQESMTQLLDAVILADL